MSNAKKIKIVITILTIVIGYFFKDTIGIDTDNT